MVLSNCMMETVDFRAWPVFRSKKKDISLCSFHLLILLLNISETGDLLLLGTCERL